MSGIYSVEVGDQFASATTGATVEVVKIWFEFSLADQRWETSLSWNVKHSSVESYQLSGKAREFVQTLQESTYVRVNKDDEISFTPLSPPTTNSNTKLQQWENDFRQNATRYGLQPTDLGRKISLGKNRPKNHTIIGAKPRNYKMPILIRGKRGGIYKITAERAKAGL